jgi:tetratricopeptide (TPR) repeat protein
MGAPAIARGLLAALIAWGAGTAHADGRDDARKHFQAGKRHHDAGEWDAALDEYLRAYQLDPSPAFLFNIGQIYRLEGDREKALDYYQRYLEAAPHAQGSEEARTFAAKLKSELEAEAAARRAHEAEVARAQAEAQRRVEEARQEKLEIDRNAAVAAQDNAAQARRKAERRLRYAGIASAAAGAIGIALGVKFGIDARDLQSEVTNPSLRQTGWTTALDQAASEGQSRNLAMEISIGVGGALIVGGAVLTFLGRPGREATVAPLVGAHTAGAELGWRF